MPEGKFLMKILPRPRVYLVDRRSVTNRVFSLGDFDVGLSGICHGSEPNFRLIESEIPDKNPGNNPIRRGIRGGREYRDVLVRLLSSPLVLYTGWNGLSFY